MQNTARVIHLIHPDEKFVYAHANLLHTYLDCAEHDILYLHYDREQYANSAFAVRQMDYRVIPSRPGTLIRLVQLLSGYDYIIFHSLFLHGAVKLALLLRPELLRKSVWIEFGADLYGGSGGGLSIHEAFRQSVAKHCLAFVGIFPPDCDYFRERFPQSRARVFYARYISGKPVANLYDGCLENGSTPLNKKRESGEPVTIQIGHNAKESLNHIAVLHQLQHLSNENIRLLLPLSYGAGADYVAKVEELAERLFPGKVDCLKEFMPREQYFKLIGKVDIAIFETKRQAGLANIHNLISRGVKLYFPEDAVMYAYFQKMGVPVYRTETLRNISYAELAAPPVSGDIRAFNKFISDYYSTEKSIENWKSFYDYLLNGSEQGGA